MQISGGMCLVSIVSAKMTASSAKSRSVNLSSPIDAPGELELTVRPIIQSIQTLNRDGARTHPCRTPVGYNKDI